MSIESEGLHKKTVEKPKEPEKSSEGVEKKIYKLETGESVEVAVKEFEYAPDAHDTTNSEEQEKQPEVNVVFLPGWVMAADSPAVTNLGEAFAKQSKGKAFSVTTRAETAPGTEDPLYKEALAISEFIKEKGLKNVVLAGHSQGGDKAIDLATILQENPNIDVRGLILLDSVGLYEQTPMGLATDFSIDGAIKTPAGIGSHVFKTVKTMVENTSAEKPAVIKNPDALSQSLKAGNSVVAGIFREIGRSGLSSVGRMTDEVKVMARENPRLAQVEVPVVLVSGAEDTISTPETIVPGWKEKEVDSETGMENYTVKREEHLKETMFPNSPYIRAVFPEKLGHHGVPIFRSESVAKSSLYLLRRFERTQSKLPVEDLKSEGL